MNIIFLGAPGAGKGTQAQKVSEKYGIPTVSTGNILKAAIKDKTPLGLEAARYIDEGKLVPDEVVIGIVKDRLSQPDCSEGFILDGFPRTIPQAEALEKMGVRIDKVVEIDVPDSAIIERMSGRRICSNCGDTYHTLYKKPAVDGKCDLCSGDLIIRKDDEPETVLKRLEVYHAETEPLKDFYSSRGLLVSVPGQEKVEDTSRLTFAALDNA